MSSDSDYRSRTARQGASRNPGHFTSNDNYETASASTALLVPEASAVITMFRILIAPGCNLIHQRNAPRLLRCGGEVERERDPPCPSD
jgi:hypothetical protein